MVTIATTPMNTAASTDSADMPHVLGDPADALWQGTAERVNANFAAVSAWCQTQTNLINSSKIPPAVVTGASVITPATNWSLTGGFAEARTLTFYAGVKLVFLNLRLLWNGPGIIIDGGLVSQQMGTLAAAYRPQAITGNYYRSSGYYYNKGPTTDPTQVCCDVGVLSSGACWLYSVSVPWASAEKPVQITWSVSFFTGNS